MCGIAGAVTAIAMPPERIAKTLGTMASRGPDGQGSTLHKLGDRVATLLHTRLSIVDLDARSDQPFHKNGLTLVYNGEVYNYPELRRELTLQGVGFETSGDTEVILEAYRKWGTDSFRRFEGMWALAIYDHREESLIVSRDRFGEKPLYIWRNEGECFFASEVKAIAALSGMKPEINLDQIRRYLVNGYKSLYAAKQTFYRNVEEFPPGCFATIKQNEEWRPQRYWNLNFLPKEKMTLSDAIEGARSEVRRAIKYRLRADVPVAIRLSGGIDSNVIMGVAQNDLGLDIAAFSILDDDPRYDETTSINEAVAYFNCRHTPVKIRREGFLDRLSRLVDYFDGPLMTISYYLHALVSEAIHDAGYKVSLGGTGADELFTGYYDHYLFWLATQKSQPDFDSLVEEWRGTYGRFVRNPFLQDPLAFVNDPATRDHIFLGAERFAEFLHEPFHESHVELGLAEDVLRNRLLNELFAETVPVMLHEDDLASMAFSVENRAAYLDSGLAEFLFSVPTEHLIHDGLPKYLLRQIGERLAAPSIMKNPRKQGINAPVTDLVDLGDPGVRECILDNSPFYDLVDRAKVEVFLSDRIALNSESKFLFSLISAKLFVDSKA